MSQIVLDLEAFKALSSDTRLAILKALDARPLTVSELGRLLDLNKATVFEHLKQLTAAELVKKDDEGRKWIYYKLTWKGRNVVHPENVQFMLLLTTALVSLGGIIAVAAGLTLAAMGGGIGQESMDEFAPSGAPDDQQADVASDSSGASQPAPEMLRAGAPEDGQRGDAEAPWYQNVNLWLLVALVIVVSASSALAARQYAQRRRARQRVVNRLEAIGPVAQQD